MGHRFFNRKSWSLYFATTQQETAINISPPNPWEILCRKKAVLQGCNPQTLRLDWEKLRTECSKHVSPPPTFISSSKIFANIGTHSSGLRKGVGSNCPKGRK